jgi:hypothetical protein
LPTGARRSGPGHGDAPSNSWWVYIFIDDHNIYIYINYTNHNIIRKNI